MSEVTTRAAAIAKAGRCIAFADAHLAKTLTEVERQGVAILSGEIAARLFAASSFLAREHLPARLVVEKLAGGDWHAVDRWAEAGRAFVLANQAAIVRAAERGSLSGEDDVLDVSPSTRKSEAQDTEEVRGWQLAQARAMYAAGSRGVAG